MDQQLQRFAANGAAMHYRQSGKGPAMIFIPGSISDYRTWTSVSPHFEKDFSCFVLSRRFQFPGSYAKHADSGVGINTEDIAQFIREKGLGPALLVGHSFGAFIALNVAIQHPELVKGVVAEEPIFAPALASNPKNPLELLGLLIKNFKAGKSFARLGMKGIDPTFKSLAKGDTQSAQQSFIDGITEGKKTPETLDELTRVQLRDNIAALEGEDPFNNQLRMADAKRIACKVLLISGAESPYVFRYINEQLVRTIPHAHHIVVEKASHWIHIDQGEAYKTELNAFVKKVGISFREEILV
ncbi:MAG: alpha/beta hydrolase [Saprospirales bacterium]|nr:alpha/beta hydrolase [Saprospirales bacterium]